MHHGNGGYVVQRIEPEYRIVPAKRPKRQLRHRRAPKLGSNFYCTVCSGNARWYADIIYDGKRHKLGPFDTNAQAKEAGKLIRQIAEERQSQSPAKPKVTPSEQFKAEMEEIKQEIREGEYSRAPKLPELKARLLKMQRLATSMNSSSQGEQKRAAVYERAPFKVGQRVNYAPALARTDSSQEYRSEGVYVKEGKVVNVFFSKPTHKVHGDGFHFTIGFADGSVKTCVKTIELRVRETGERRNKRRRRRRMQQELEDKSAQALQCRWRGCKARARVEWIKAEAGKTPEEQMQDDSLLMLESSWRGDTAQHHLRATMQLREERQRLIKQNEQFLHRARTAREEKEAASQEAEELLEMQTACALMMQCSYRQLQARRRHGLHKTQFLLNQHSAVELQRHWRGEAARVRASVLRGQKRYDESEAEIVLWIQCRWRGGQARRAATRLRQELAETMALAEVEAQRRRRKWGGLYAPLTSAVEKVKRVVKVNSGAGGGGGGGNFLAKRYRSGHVARLYAGIEAEAEREQQMGADKRAAIGALLKQVDALLAPPSGR
jgi:hypothetical protein